MDTTDPDDDWTDPHLRRFTIATAVTGGGVASMWLGWPFVISMSLIAIFHVARFVYAQPTRAD